MGFIIFIYTFLSRFSFPFLQVERRADDFQRLKERALESLLRMKRAGELDRMAQAPPFF